MSHSGTLGLVVAIGRSLLVNFDFVPAIQGMQGDPDVAWISGVEGWAEAVPEDVCKRSPGPLGSRAGEQLFQFHPRIKSEVSIWTPSRVSVTTPTCFRPA